MPVIINDFDIMTDSAEQQHAARRRARARTAPQAQQPPPLRPEDIKQVMRINRDRMERVRAD